MSTRLASMPVALAPVALAACFVLAACSAVPSASTGHHSGSVIGRSFGGE
jgi:starvation-inducible outer membrane lipoprotein